MKKIIVATDFSKGSMNATRFAIALAKSQNASLMLVHAYESPVFYTSDMPLSNIEDAERAAKNGAEKDMKAFEDSLRSNLEGVKHESVWHMGLPGDVVATQAEHWEAEMIIAASTSASKLEQAIIGSTISSIINKAPCRVMVIPPNATFHPFKKAVFATDMQEAHIQEVIQAEDLLEPMDTELDFLFIDTKVHSDSEELDNRISRLVKQQTWYGNRSAFVSTDTDIEAGIASFIKETQADLAIMVTEHRRFPSMLFHRSLTKKMSKHPDIPLLVLQPQRNKVTSY